MVLVEQAIDSVGPPAHWLRLHDTGPVQGRNQLVAHSPLLLFSSPLLLFCVVVEGRGNCCLAGVDGVCMKQVMPE